MSVGYPYSWAAADAFQHAGSSEIAAVQPAAMTTAASQSAAAAAAVVVAAAAAAVVVVVRPAVFDADAAIAH